MSIEIREYIGSSMNITESTIKKPTNLSESFNEIGPISKNSIIQLIEGIHVGPTRNFTWYTEEALKSSVPTWTKPYQRPLIMHHNEKDGKTIGRILSVEYTTKNTRSGTPALIYTCNVPDKDGKEQILDGRLKTVSIGVIAHDVRCSICGKQLELDEDGHPECGHYRGSSYDGEICYWKIYKMEAKELSYVIVPSDIYAHNLKTYTSDDYKKSINTTEGVNNMSVNNINLTEGQAIDEEVKKDTETPVAETEKKDEPKVEDNIENKDKEESKPEVKDEKEEPKTEDKPAEEKPEVDPKDKEIEDLKAKLEKVEAEKDAITKDLIAVKKDLEATTKKVEETILDLNSKTAELETEIKLKESVEAELINAKLSIRESKEAEFNALRRVAGKDIVLTEALSKRSDESLMDAICDLKEEVEGVSKLKHITEAANPIIPKEKIENKNKPNVKESKSVGNINVEEGLSDIISNMFNPRYF